MELDCSSLQGETMLGLDWHKFGKLHIMYKIHIKCGDHQWVEFTTACSAAEHFE